MVNEFNLENFNKAIELFNTAQYAYAQTIFDSLVLEYPYNPEVRHYQHLCRIKQHQTTPPSLFKRILSTIMALPLVPYSIILFLTETNDKAYLVYQKRIAYTPLSIKLYNQCIQLLEKNNKIKDISFYLKEILAIDINNKESLKYLGELYLKNNQLAEAKQTYTKLHEIDPNNEDLKRAFSHITALEALQKNKQS